MMCIILTPHRVILPLIPVDPALARCSIGRRAGTDKPSRSRKQMENSRCAQASFSGITPTARLAATTRKGRIKIGDQHPIAHRPRP